MAECALNVVRRKDRRPSRAFALIRSAVVMVPVASFLLLVRGLFACSAATERITKTSQNITSEIGIHITIDETVKVTIFAYSYVVRNWHP